MARYDPTADVFEIVGRRSRFVKPFGLRIDLDAVETELAAAGFDVVATGDDDVLVVGAPGGPVEAIKQRVVALTGLPAGAVCVEAAPVPRTASGKVDYETLRARARPARPSGNGQGRCTSVADVYTKVLGRSDVVATSTFLSLGGDSLSYVECSVRLEEMLGPLPADWHLRTVASLDAADRRRGPPRLDTTALLRAVGICAVVATHMSLWYFPGGAHLMLAVVGFNFSRFHLSIDGTADRARAVARTITRIAIPVIAFVGTYMLLAGGYGAATLGLVNNYLGPPSHHDGNWHYWFIEAMIQVMVVVTALLAVAPVRRLERRHQYVLPLLLLGGTLLLRGRWEVIDGVYNLRFQTHGVAWFFVLGWLVHRSTNPGLKVLTSVLCLLTLPGFFGRPEREWFIALGLIVLVWCRDVPLPRFAVRGVALVAAASMVIFISHFRIFPPLDRNLPRGVAYAATIAAGIALWFAGEHAARLARRTTARLGARRRASAPTTTIAVALD